MRSKSVVRAAWAIRLLSGAAAWAAFSGSALAVDILSPDDFIISVDIDAEAPGSASPDMEGILNLIDGDAGTKYLNFGENGSGFIITTGASVLQSFTLTTANDAEGRDPVNYVLWGTNDPIASTDHSSGQAENWTYISQGLLGLPAARQTASSPYNLTNTTSFTSYRMIFPAVKNPFENSMQIAGAQFYTEPDATGTTLVSASASALAIDMPASAGSLYPTNEGPKKLIDTNPISKFLNFGKENTGFIVTPAAGKSIVTSFTITTANDFTARDPGSWALYGTNDEILSFDNSAGDYELWTLIDSDLFSLTTNRNETSAPIMIDNAMAYTSYRLVFPTLRDSGNANSIQFAEIQFDGILIPEPSMATLALLGLTTVGLRRRR